MNRASRKEIATTFLRMASSGDVRKAYANFVAPGFRHHNPHFAGDAESLATAMEQNAVQLPDKRLEIQRAIEEGDVVAVHSRIVPHPGHNGIAVVHLFRFDEGRIVELWDIGQAVPADSPNQYGMF